MEKGLKMKGCKKLEVALEILKVDYEKLWVALIGSVGGLGTLLLKGIFSWLTVVAALLIIAEVVGLFFIRFKIFHIAEELNNCPEREDS